MKLLGTVRLSHETDESTSPARQTEQITTYAKLHSHKLIAITEDLDISGAKSVFDRPELGLWLTDPDKISQWDILCAAKLDRLSRSLLDFAQLAKWCRENNKTIVSISESIDFSTPVGRLIANILIMFAEFERERMSERRAEAQAALRKQARWGGGSPPYGYKPQKNGNGYVLVQDSKTAPVVADMISLLLAGTSMNEIARQFTARKIPAPKGGTTWHADSLSRILRSPAMLGHVTKAGSGEDAQIERGQDGMPVSFTDTPLADAQTYAKVREVISALTANKGKGVRRDAAPLLGIAKCGECGSPLYSHVVKPRLYYKCDGIRTGACQSRSFRKEALETAVYEKFLAEAGTFADIELHTDPAEDHTAEISLVKQQIEQVDAEFRTGEMTAKTYSRMSAQLEADLERLESLPVRPERKSWVTVGPSVAQKFTPMSPAERRNYLLSHAVTTSVTAGSNGPEVDLALGDFTEQAQLQADVASGKLKLAK
jgi:DNA invertase Pin-like site-specific DNA recombinase